MNDEKIDPMVSASRDLKQLKNKTKTESDKKIIDEIERIVKKTTNHIEKFELNLAAEGLYEFVWHEYADKHIEDVKNRIDKDSYTVLLSIFIVQLKLLHPFMPFITEELFGKYTGNILITDKWPDLQ